MTLSAKIYIDWVTFGISFYLRVSTSLFEIDISAFNPFYWRWSWAWSVSKTSKAHCYLLVTPVLSFGFSFIKVKL
jgi:hypothetical protein